MIWQESIWKRSFILLQESYNLKNLQWILIVHQYFDFNLVAKNISPAKKAQIVFFRHKMYFVFRNPVLLQIWTQNWGFHNKKNSLRIYYFCVHSKSQFWNISIQKFNLSKLFWTSNLTQTSSDICTLISILHFLWTYILQPHWAKSILFLHTQGHSKNHFSPLKK